MKKTNTILWTILILTGVVFYSGCAASSNSLRYKEKTSSANKEDNAVRFSSEKDKDNLAASDTLQPDTLTAADDSSDPDDIPANDTKIDISSLLKKYSDSDSQKEYKADKSNAREKMLMEIIKYLDTPYKYGGNTKNGIDCSAFTQTIFERTFAVTLERSARDQFREGEVIDNEDDLKFGDLVFFNTRRRVRPGHVGIYIGDHLFAHASTKNGVTVSSLDEAYYSKRFMGGRRIENLLGSAKLSGSN